MQEPRRARRLLPVLLLSWLWLACGSGDPLEQARKRQDAGDYAGSLELLQSLAAQRTKDPEVQYRYGLALVRTGQPSLAIWSLRAAMDDPEWLDKASRELARSAISTANADAAVEAMDRLLEKKPEDVDALVLRAKAKVATRRDFEGALADADRAVALDPDHNDALVMRAVALLLLTRTDEAEAALKDLEARAVDVDLGLDVGARFCVARAMFAQAKEQWDDAEAQYQKCLAAFPADESVVGQAIGFYDEREKPERVLEILQQIVAADPLASLARQGLAQRLEVAGRGDEAEKVLREGTTVKDPELVSVAWVDLANLYGSRGDLKASVDALGHAMETTREPRPELVYQYADTLVMTGDLARAREVATKLTVPAHRELLEARVLMQEGKLEAALDRFDAGLRLWPDNAVARYYAARTAERLGRFERAVDDYRYSIRAGVAQTDARFRLARLLEASRAYEQAVGVARHATANAPADPAAERVALRILARLGRLDDVRPLLRSLAEDPARWGESVAAMAQGMREASGPAEAARFLREAQALDLKDPRSAAALRELVIAESEAGHAAAALAAADAALKAHPDEASFHALRGLALAKSDAAKARAAYERALELDAKNAEALVGLARLEAAAGGNDRALELYGRAIAAQADAELGDPEPWRESADLLLRVGRRDEAIARLEQLLLRDPYDSRAAARLAGLRVEQPDGREQALALAKRAVFFGRSPEAFHMLALVHRARGEDAQAAEAHAHAERARAGGEPASEDASKS
jgi:tetratricopeptide (TPR) repeat protein